LSGARLSHTVSFGDDSDSVSLKRHLGNTIDIGASKGIQNEN